MSTAFGWPPVTPVASRVFFDVDATHELVGIAEDLAVKLRCTQRIVDDESRVTFEAVARDLDEGGALLRSAIANGDEIAAKRGQRMVLAATTASTDAARRASLRAGMVEEPR